MTTRGRWWRLASLRTTFRYHPHRMSAALGATRNGLDVDDKPAVSPTLRAHTADRRRTTGPADVERGPVRSARGTLRHGARGKGMPSCCLRATRGSLCPGQARARESLPFEAVVLHGLPGASVGAPAGVWAARPPEAAMPRDEAAAQGAHLLQRCSCRHPARCRRPPSRADSQDADGWSQLPATSIRAGQRSRGSERNTPIAKYCAAPP